MLKKSNPLSNSIRGQGCVRDKKHNAFGKHSPEPVVYSPENVKIMLEFEFLLKVLWWPLVSAEVLFMNDRSFFYLAKKAQIVKYDKV